MDENLLPPWTSISTSEGIEPYYDWCEPPPFSWKQLALYFLLHGGTGKRDIFQDEWKAINRVQGGAEWHATHVHIEASEFHLDDKAGS